MARDQLEDKKKKSKKSTKSSVIQRRRVKESLPQKELREQSQQAQDKAFPKKAAALRQITKIIETDEGQKAFRRLAAGKTGLSKMSRHSLMRIVESGVSPKVRRLAEEELKRRQKK